MLFDLNGFKGYYDSLGHPAGDALSELVVELVWPPERSAATAGGPDPVRDRT